MEEVITFNYLELHEYARADANWSIYLPRLIRTKVDIPIWRNNEVVWTNEYTTEEAQAYITMLNGLYGLYLQYNEKIIEGEITTFKMNILTHPLFAPLGGFFSLIPQVPTAETQDTAMITQLACKQWQLQRTFPITSKAALFYIIYTRHLRGDERATMELQYMMDAYAPMIARYLDMVAGGEVRHMLSRARAYTKGIVDADIETEALSSPYIDNTENLLKLVVPKVISSTVLQEKARNVAWTKWYEIRQAAGIIALDWCIMKHMCSSSAGFGGVMWANCANLVRKREKGLISDIFFLDQAFSLQHNNGNIFNKLWNITGLQAVLTCAFEGNIEQLPKYLNEKDKKFYHDTFVQISNVETKQRKGVLNNTERVLHTHDKSLVLQIDPTTVLAKIGATLEQKEEKVT